MSDTEQNVISFFSKKYLESAATHMKDPQLMTEVGLLKTLESTDLEFLRQRCVVYYQLVMALSGKVEGLQAAIQVLRGSE